MKKFLLLVNGFNIRVIYLFAFPCQIPFRLYTVIIGHEIKGSTTFCCFNRYFIINYVRL